MPPVDAQSRSRLAPEKASKISSEITHDRFHPLPHVVSTRAGDATVLMDIERGTYHTLNEVGGRVWELVGAGFAVPAIVERLLEDYEVLPAQLEADVAALIQGFLEEQFIAHGAEPAPAVSAGRPKALTSRAAVDGRAPRVPSVLRCSCMILAVKLALKVRGFERTISWIRRRVEEISVTDSASMGTVRAAEYAVAMAGALYPGRAKCLEQSLALYYLLRQEGVALRYCQGVQAYPFQAHAWIEYRGEIINDVPEHALRFARLSDRLP